MSDWEEVKDRAQMFIKRDDDTIAIQTTTTIVTIMDLIAVGDELQREIATKDAELARLREEKQRIVECPCCGEVFILYSDGTIDAFIGA